jgi:2-dehydro-3-deoxyphosphogluconate aldolase/(4S)-4-hydroxy-2-oxoglutarate aldolase
MIADLAELRAIAILRTRAPAEHLLRAARAIARAGVRFVEITLTSPGAVEVLAALAKDTQAVLGAGTVTSPEKLDTVVDAGARFVVTPVVAFPVIARARARGIPIICGASTPTEAFSAAGAGADLVKIFPARQLGGPDYIRAMLGPLPDLRLVPTGGVQVEDAANYLRAGAFAVGVGGSAFDVTLPDDELARRARALALLATRGSAA